MKPGDEIHWNDDADAAREFCRVRGLGPDDVKLVKRDGRVIVVVKRECVVKVPE